MYVYFGRHSRVGNEIIDGFLRGKKKLIRNNVVLLFVRYRYYFCFFFFKNIQEIFSKGLSR